MFVVADNECCARRYGAIHKLVIVGVGGYKIKMESRRNVFHVARIFNCFNDIGGKLLVASYTQQNFLIFKQNVGTHTKCTFRVGKPAKCRVRTSQEPKSVEGS